VRGYFDKIDGSGSQNLFNNFYTFNFNEVREPWPRPPACRRLYLIKTTFDTDQRTKEDTKNLYLQFNTDWDTACRCTPRSACATRRPTSPRPRWCLPPNRHQLGSQNEFRCFGDPTFTTLTGKYHNLLPSVDWDMDVRPDMKVRASYGETIGRPRYDQIAGGQILTRWCASTAAPATRATRR
jgi:hypothetical protein